MNDFYAPRRTIIADVSGLVGMGVAGTLSTALVWDTLATGFRTGKLERAFFIFLLVVLGAAAIGGLLGLMAGRTIGRKWEARHRAHRAAPTPDESSPAVVGEPARRQADDIAIASAPGVMLRTFGADVAEFLSLVERSGVAGGTRTADVLRRSVNIGAWDGPRLVGAVRFVSDGRVGLAVDLLVEPAYRRRGIGRALADIARTRAGGALVFAASQPDAELFLEGIGARRAESAWRV